MFFNSSRTSATGGAACLRAEEVPLLRVSARAEGLSVSTAAALAGRGGGVLPGRTAVGPLAAGVAGRGGGVADGAGAAAAGVG